uniref:HAT C-terminal dimerisation domain-containing protein n=1 Tax=Octopus bimaculoides TaxID=37653 RepID=A0A0L8IGJ1_OCTBM
MLDEIAHYDRNEILEILKKQKFSVLIDERENGSSRGLYDAVKSTLTKEDVSMSNILGFASDNYSTLMGNESVFQKLLRNDIPTVFTIGCVCHSFAPCSNHAVKSIIPLATNFPAIAPENTLDKIDDEWKLFRQYKDIPVSSKSIPEFWYSMHNLKDGLDHSKFERLSQFMTNVTVLPYSSECVERIFSQVNCTKTKFTNRLKTETITDRLLAKQAITRKGAICISWEPNAKLIKNVVDGSCHRRYMSRLHFKKGGVNEDDVDMYEIDN